MVSVYLMQITNEGLSSEPERESFFAIYDGKTESAYSSFNDLVFHLRQAKEKPSFNIPLPTHQVNPEEVRVIIRDRKPIGHFRRLQIRMNT